MVCPLLPPTFRPLRKRGCDSSLPHWITDLVYYRGRYAVGKEVAKVEVGVDRNIVSNRWRKGSQRECGAYESEDRKLLPRYFFPPPALILIVR